MKDGSYRIYGAAWGGPVAKVDRAPLHGTPEFHLALVESPRRAGLRPQDREALDARPT